MKLFKPIFVCLMILATAASYAATLDGSFSSSYEMLKEKGQDATGMWENYLTLDDAPLYNPYVSFNFYGKFSHDDGTGNNYTNVYSSYLDYSSFEKAVEVKLGRFSYVDNKFLTLDGGMATVKTDYNVGFTAFAGAPHYFDTDDRHINETFRHTGDKLYGGKVFLNGVQDTTGYLSYSKETDGSETLQQLVGLGLGRVLYDQGTNKVDLDGKLEYDTESKDIYKGVARLYVKHDKLNIITDYTRYNVQDGTDYSEELIISNFATGKEERYGLTMQYGLTDNITPYASLKKTEMEIASGAIAKGSMYTLGTEFNYLKEIGVSSTLEGYYYNSEISNAKGASVNVDWSLSKALRLAFEGELVRMDNSYVNETVSSVYLKAEYDLMKDLTLTAYGENNKDTRYLPQNRYGVKVAYSF